MNNLVDMYYPCYTFHKYLSATPIHLIYSFSIILCFIRQMWIVSFKHEKLEIWKTKVTHWLIFSIIGPFETEAVPQICSQISPARPDTNFWQVKKNIWFTVFPYYTLGLEYVPVTNHFDGVRLHCPLPSYDTYLLDSARQRLGSSCSSPD